MANNRFTAAAQQATALTNKQLGEKIAAQSSLSQQRIRDLLPTKADRSAFVKLMAEVDADTQMETKLNFLKDNINTVGGVAIKLLKALV